MSFVRLELVQTVDEALDVIVQESGSTREAFLLAYRTGVGYRIAEDPNWLYRYLTHLRRRFPCQCDNGCYHVDIITTSPTNQAPGLVFESLFLFQQEWKWGRVTAKDVDSSLVPEQSLWRGFDYGFPSR